MSPSGVQKGPREGGNGVMGGQTGLEMPPLRAPKELTRTQNGHGELLGLPRCNLRAPRCGNGAPRCGNRARETILGRNLGAQKGSKMAPISNTKRIEIGE